MSITQRFGAGCSTTLSRILLLIAFPSLSAEWFAGEIGENFFFAIISSNEDAV